MVEARGGVKQTARVLGAGELSVGSNGRWSLVPVRRLVSKRANARKPGGQCPALLQVYVPVEGEQVKARWRQGEGVCVSRGQATSEACDLRVGTKSRRDSARIHVWRLWMQRAGPDGVCGEWMGGRVMGGW